MASNGNDADGNPLFPEEDALQSGADLEEVARYAAFRGNSFRGTTTERAAFAFAREGMTWFDTTLDTMFLHDGTNWTVFQGPITTGVTFGTGWATTGGLAQHVPRLVIQGKIVSLFGSVTSSSGFGYANILTVPVAFRPSNGSTRFVGSGVASNGMAYELALTSGVLSVPTGYATGTIPVANAHPLICSWLID